MSVKNPNLLNEDLLKELFIHNLNRLYFGKCYLNEHLEHLMSFASFTSLQLAIEEFWDGVKSQIKRMDEIYELMHEKPSDKNCNPIRSIVKDEFCLSDKQNMPIIVDMDLIAYIQLLEHINITACRTLKMLAKALKNEPVTQLLTECFDESKDNDHLFTLIAQEYITQD